MIMGNNFFQFLSSFCFVQSKTLLDKREGNALLCNGRVKVYAIDRNRI